MSLLDLEERGAEHHSGMSSLSLSSYSSEYSMDTLNPMDVHLLVGLKEASGCLLTGIAVLIELRQVLRAEAALE